jgi:hypothetical protein
MAELFDMSGVKKSLQELTELANRHERPYSGGEPPGGDDMQELKTRVTELEKNYLQTAVNLASIRTKVDELPNKDWVHLRLWAVALFIVAATGLMIRFLPAAG